MLQIFTSTKNLKFGELCSVYSDDLATIQAEQDFYGFLMDFLRTPGSLYALWILDDRYVSALRIEPYKDGVLLAGLHTRPEFREKGYAEALMTNTLSHLFEQGVQKIYSHIRNDNISSMKAHHKCGFEKISDCAVYIDGSADWRAATYLKNRVSQRK